MVGLQVGSAWHWLIGFSLVAGLPAVASPESVESHCATHRVSLERAIDQLAISNLVYERLCAIREGTPVRGVIRWADAVRQQCDCVQAGMAHAQALVTLHASAGMPAPGDAPPICAWAGDANDEWQEQVMKRSADLRDGARVEKRVADIQQLAPLCAMHESCSPAPLLQCWLLGASG